MGADRAVRRSSRLVDGVKFDDRPPWPLGADGYGSSLERICPTASGDDPANWASAELKRDDRIGGTPRPRQRVLLGHPLAQRLRGAVDPRRPVGPVPVTAVVEDATGVQAVALAWWVWSGPGAAKWTEAPMKRESGDAKRGTYGGSIRRSPRGG